MANAKISALTAATTPLVGTEVLPIVQSTTTKKVSIENVTAGRGVPVDHIITSGVAVKVAGTSNFSKPSADIQITLERTGSNAGWSGIGATATYAQIIYNSSLTPVFAIRQTGDVEPILGNLKPIAGKGVDFSANTPAAGMTSRLLNWYEEGTFTAARTGFVEVLGGGTITSTGVYTRVGRIVNIQIILTCTGAATIEGNGGAGSYFSIPYAAGQNTPGTWTNNTLFNSTGAVVASGANLFIVTGWAASGNQRVFTATYSV